MGRKKIKVGNEKITAENAADILFKAYQKHLENRQAIEFLLEYEKGKQPIMTRKKKVRSEINYRIVENHASEVVDFYKGYIFGNPIAYTQHTVEDDPGTREIENSGGVYLLGRMFLEENKNAKDQQLVKDILTCGVGYRMVLPKKVKSKWETAPFRLIPLDVKDTFLIRSVGVDERVIGGVTYYVDTENIPRFTVYTDESVFFVDGNPDGFAVNKAEENGMGVQPIVEYTLDNDRMGIFEKALPVLDAINLCTSDRLNGLAQHIQSFIWLNNVDIDKSELDRLIHDMFLLTQNSEGAAAANVEYLTSELNQESEQVLKDDLYESLLRITGVPNREGNTGGDTGQAVILRNGFAVAESKAKSMEPIFEACERDLLIIVLNVVDRANIKDFEEVSKLRLSDIDIKISRNRNDELLTKLQALYTALNCGVNPYDALVTIGLFDDPDKVYKNSLPYLEKWRYEDDAEVTGNESQISVRESR